MRAVCPPAVLFLIPVLVAAPVAAQEADPPAEPQSTAAAAEDAAEEEDPEAGEPGEEEKEKKKRKEGRRKKEREAAEADGGGAGSEASTAGEGGESDEAGSDDGDAAEEGEDGEEDGDEEKPVLLRLTTDEPCLVSVDGRMKGTLEPDEELEVGVELGEVVLRATSVDVPGAAFERTLDLEEPGERSIRIRIEKAIRDFRRRERREGVFRDRKTGLMWVKRDSNRDLDWQAAGEYCEDLQTGGHESWRLPTREELASLNAIWQRTGFKIIGGITLSQCCVWSSDRQGDRAWTYDYRFRRDFPTNVGYELGLRALCVSEWDPEAEAGEEGGDGQDGDSGAGGEG